MNTAATRTESSKTLLLPTALSEGNKKALQAFFDGSADRDVMNSTFRAGFAELATVQNGMLHFASIATVNTFSNRMQTLKNTWNYTQNSDLICDAAVKSVEQTLGYTSLSSQYNIQENNNVAITDALHDPDLLTLLNEQKEVWVADTIYKYLVPGVAFKIVNNDFTALTKARQRGWETYANNVYLVDERIGQTTFRGITGTCGLKVTLFSKSENTLGANSATVIVDAVDAAGNLLKTCAVKGKVNWGDGTPLESITFTGSTALFHNYSMSPNTNSAFLITAAGQGILECETSCGSLNSGFLTLPLSAATCTSKWDEIPKDFPFAVNGTGYTLHTFCGQRTKSTIFSSKSLWADATLRKTLTGKKVKPGSNMIITNVGGSLFAGMDDCSGIPIPLVFPASSPITSSSGGISLFPPQNFATSSDPSVNPRYRFIVNHSGLTSADLNMVRSLWKP